MTIIVAMDRMMVADSGESQGAVMRMVGVNKIARNSLGWIFAGAGGSHHCKQVMDWFMAGMKPSERPEIKEDDFSGLLMSPEGRAYRIDKNLIPYQQTEPAICGELAAEAFVLGAIKAGASPEAAIGLACDWCVWARGPVQVERLDQRPAYGENYQQQVVGVQ